MKGRWTWPYASRVLGGGLLLGGLLTTPVFATTTAPQYDANGNLTSQTTVQGTVTYTYDERDRLQSEAGPGVNQAFTYDPNGNRQSDGAHVYTLAPDGNRIQTVNGVTRTHDPAGNLLDDGQGKTYTYNAAGRLKEVRVNNVPVATYIYNAAGQRTQKITPQGTREYHYDPRGRLIEVTDAQGNPRAATVWLNDTPIAQIDTAQTPEKVAYLHTDHLNTPRSATDATRKVVWRWEGEAFGGTLPEEDPDNDGIATTINLRLPGQYYDSETGLHYNWNRYYDPATGRYITSDPIGLHGGLNTYAYVGSNPLRWFDIFGLDPFLASRPLQGKSGALLSHNFVVTNARFIGDPNAVIYSFGQNNSGNVGRVDENTVGFSSTTFLADADFWRGLSNQGCPVEDSNVSSIPATDAQVERYVNSLIENRDYAALAGVFGANSNSAAQAIANSASGQQVPTPGWPRYSLGAGSWREIQFQTNQ